MIELREVDDAVREELIRSVVIPEEQQRFVSTVERSLAEAVEAPEANPWYRGVYDGGEPVGFVMIAWDVTTEDGLIGPWFLWKLAIDRRHQRRGYGQAVVGAIVDIVRSNGGTELFTSYVDEPGGPGPFYARLGFTPAGDHEGEVLVVKAL
ncbi:MAG TPA: GNAT family N-acetyltransferase [Nocardioides sp.]|nr:GNAT family N-acetyltransferase [Nocardioides sp.]